MRGSVGVFFENVRKIVFVHKKCGSNGIQGQILGDMLAYVVYSFCYARVVFAVKCEIVGILQEVLSQNHEQRFYALFVFYVRAESVIL